MPPERISVALLQRKRGFPRRRSAYAFSGSRWVRTRRLEPVVAAWRPKPLYYAQVGKTFSSLVRPDTLTEYCPQTGSFIDRALLWTAQ